MAIVEKKANSKTAKKANINVQAVSNVRRFESGNISFSVLVNDVWIHNMTIIISEKANDGWFISFPQRKGNNGNYYSYAYFFIDDATKKRIEELVNEELTE